MDNRIIKDFGKLFEYFFSHKEDKRYFEIKELITKKDPFFKSDLLNVNSHLAIRFSFGNPSKYPIEKLYNDLSDYLENSYPDLYDILKSSDKTNKPFSRLSLKNNSLESLTFEEYLEEDLELESIAQLYLNQKNESKIENDFTLNIIANDFSSIERDPPNPDIYQILLDSIYKEDPDTIVGFFKKFGRIKNCFYKIFLENEYDFGKNMINLNLATATYIFNSFEKTNPELYKKIQCSKLN